jgi:hypothetical protein
MRQSPRTRRGKRQTAVLLQADAVEAVAAEVGEAVDVAVHAAEVVAVADADVDGVSKRATGELKTAKDENTHIQAGLRGRTMHVRD